VKGVGNRYSLIVGLIFLVLIGLATLHTLNGGGEDTLGLDKQPLRWPLPEFAVPAAAGNLEGDANVYQDDCASSSLPCSESRVPACQIATRGAIRVCDLFDRPLVLSFWFGTESGCERQQNVVSTVAERYRGRVNFLSLDIRDSRGAVREHGWEMPVGFDRDGAVAALYRIGGCPTFAYAYPGGILQSASSGELGVGALSQHVRELLNATRVAERG